MRHRSLRELLDEMLDDPRELFITSKSKHCALVTLKDDTTLLLYGDFSGTPEECEAEVRRILTDNRRRNRRRRGHAPH